MPYRLTRTGKLVPGDPAFGTRWSTAWEKELARKALKDLEMYRNVIVLVPAPHPHFDGHMIRVQEQKNPDWYIEFGRKFWRSRRSFQLKRSRVIRALKRVREIGIVRRNGLEGELLKLLERVDREQSVRLAQG